MQLHDDHFLHPILTIIVLPKHVQVELASQAVKQPDDREGLAANRTPAVDVGELSIVLGHCI